MKNNTKYLLVRTPATSGSGVKAKILQQSPPEYTLCTLVRTIDTKLPWSLYNDSTGQVVVGPFSSAKKCIEAIPSEYKVHTVEAKYTFKDGGTDCEVKLGKTGPEVIILW